MHFTLATSKITDVLSRLAQSNADSDLELSSDDEYQPVRQDSQSQDSPNDSSETDDSNDSDDSSPDDTQIRRKLWKKVDCFTPNITDFVEEDESDQLSHQSDDSDAHPRESWSSLDYMSQYLDRDIFEQLSVCTNQNSVLLTGRSLNTSAEELQRFIGATIHMSCLGYPVLSMYWAKSTRVPAVADTISRQRYFKIRSHLKIVIDADVSDDEKKKDHLWKVRPMLERVRQGCLKQVRSRDVSIDEQMVPFSGACPYRQYVPMKPNPVGLKNYVLATPSGLVLDFVVYQGVNSFADVPEGVRIGAAGLPIAHLAATLRPGTMLYCDRYFTSIPLIEYMLQKEIYITGTIIKNRVPKDAAKLSDDKVLKLKGRGSSDMIVKSDPAISIVKWFDNKPIVIASSVHGIEPQQLCRRWSKKDRAYVEIQRPAIITEYNQKMGGVDLTDRMLSFYRVKTRTRKWTVRTLMHFTDLALVNGWLQYRQDSRNRGVPAKDVKNFLQFRLDIASAYLVTKEDSNDEEDNDDDEDAPRPAAKRQRTVPIPSTHARYSGSKHLPFMEVVKYAMRCRMDGCKGKTKVKCVECGLFLCVTTERNCFYDFHTDD